MPRVKEARGLSCELTERTLTAGTSGRGLSCLFGDGSRLGPCRCMHPPPTPTPLPPPLPGSSLPQGCNHSRLHVTAPRSNWPVTLRALGGCREGGCWWEEPPYVGLPWRLGRLMSEHAVTNDIPEPIGYSANGQFAASLTNAHAMPSTHK